jgi:hypothetical protein
MQQGPARHQHLSAHPDLPSRSPQTGEPLEAAVVLYPKQMTKVVIEKFTIHFISNIGPGE